VKALQASQESPPLKEFLLKAYKQRLFDHHLPGREMETAAQVMSAQSQPEGL
jgi:hypothetical protein